MRTPEEMANQLTRLYRTSDPFLLCEYLNIEIRFVDFGNNPLGQFMRLFDEPFILINKSLKESSQRYFVAAHELFHALHHSDLASYYVQTQFTKGKLELEANQFAGRLIFNQYKEEHGSWPETLQELEAHYGFPVADFEQYI